VPPSSQLPHEAGRVAQSGAVPHGAPILGSRALRWADEDATAASAAILAARPALDDAFIELHGPLGAGKTTFVRHLLRALGVTGRIKSPTYALLEPYEVQRGGRTLAVSHLDFYRFEDPHEWEDAGLRDVFAAPGLKLAEWPSRAAGLLPVPDLALEITPAEGDAREVTMRAYSARGLELLP
jgi:tRNA threonylcarbamoyladenosine biosynthesis protein TsaE